MGLKLDYSDVGAYSLAAQQNSYRLFKGMKLICESEEDNEHGESLTSPAKFLDVIVLKSFMLMALGYALTKYVSGLLHGIVKSV